MILAKPTPLFRANLTLAPAHPVGDRILVRPHPIAETTEGGLIIAETAQKTTFGGTIIAVGNQAADKLYDDGAELGDEIWYAQYAGVLGEWQRIARAGEDKSCAHDGSWDFLGRDNVAWKAVKEPDTNMKLRACRICGALKLSERVIVMSGDDPMYNVSLQERLESGLFKRLRGETADGKTRYYIERPVGRKDTFEIGKE